MLISRPAKFGRAARGRFHMRVITGIARGRKLKTLDGDDIVRPTTDQVKESIFSIIQFDIEGRNVLDLFAGSGQLGIEALSRGARHCVFVDSSRMSVAVTKENLEHCQLKENAEVVQSDSLAYLMRCREKFDIALLDPPYVSDLLEKALPLLAPCMNTGGVIMCEAKIEKELPEEVGGFTKRRVYRYGKIGVTLYRHSSIE